MSTVPIRVPALRERTEDIPLLFRKFATDFAERYRTTPVLLDEDARRALVGYGWPGNVRELKNIAEQISVLSPSKLLTAVELRQFLPEGNNRLPILAPQSMNGHGEFANEREILYKLFFDMKKDVTELKKMFFDVLQNPQAAGAANLSSLKGDQSFGDLNSGDFSHQSAISSPSTLPVLLDHTDIHDHVEVEESLNIMDKEKELIIKALKKHKGKRKDAALDLGISERTLYRKLKEYDIDE
jgi:DNA-binding NtrC family response regulator